MGKRLGDERVNNLHTISKNVNILAECPLWDQEKNLLHWTDISGKKVYAYDTLTGAQGILLQGKNVASFALNRHGGFVCGCFDGIYLWEKDSGFLPIATHYNGNMLKVNDGAADIMGRFIFGTNYYHTEEGKSRTGAIYSMEKNGGLRMLDDGYTLSNGIGFSPDNQTIYTTDSVRRIIYAHDYNARSGSLSNKRVFARLNESEGVPDGLAVDADGFVWSALWFGGCVVRFDPDGKEVMRYRLPAMQVSSLCFGGPRLSELFVTTASDDGRVPFSPAGYDYACACRGGEVYCLNAEIKGLPQLKADIEIGGA
jgi:D-xylonolactonase